MSTSGDYIDEDDFVRLLTEVGKKLFRMELKDRGSFSFDDQLSDVSPTKRASDAFAAAPTLAVADIAASNGSNTNIEPCGDARTNNDKDGSTFELSGPLTQKASASTQKASNRDAFFDGMGPIEKVKKWRESQQKLEAEEAKATASMATAAAGASSNLPSCYGSCPTR